MTVRVFYNRRLFKEALGEDRTPKTFDEFVALCETLQRRAQLTRQPIAPLAGSTFNLTKVTDELFGAASQRFALTLDISRDLEMSTHEALINYVAEREGFERLLPLEAKSLD